MVTTTASAAACSTRSQVIVRVARVRLENIRCPRAVRNIVWSFRNALVRGGTSLAFVANQTSALNEPNISRQLERICGMMPVSGG